MNKIGFSDVYSPSVLNQDIYYLVRARVGGLVDLKFLLVPTQFFNFLFFSSSFKVKSKCVSPHPSHDS